MKNKIIFLVAFGLSFFGLNAEAFIQFCPFMQTVKNVVPAIKEAQSKTSLPVRVPKQIPCPQKNQAYFISIDANATRYIVNVDATADCHGMHTCNIGTIQAETAGNPVIYYDMENRELTGPVKINKNLKGYFTPAHAMGDFWPGMIVWRDQNILYTITWNLSASLEKSTLLRVAKQM